MADASDVEAAIVSQLVAALYPNGTAQPSVVDATVSIDRGWPTEADVRNATAAGTQLIRVHAISGMSRDNEKYFRRWQTNPQPATTLVATLNNNVITFSGTPALGQIVGVLSKGIGYTYDVQSSDTLASVASRVAAAVPNATSSGVTVTLPVVGAIPGVDAVTGTTSYLEVGRQKTIFSISVWSTTPALRDAIFSAIMPQLGLNFRLTLPDGSVATREGLMSSGPNDVPSRADVWARDVRLTFDYPIIVSANYPAMAVGILVGPSTSTAYVV